MDCFKLLIRCSLVFGEWLKKEWIRNMEERLGWFWIRGWGLLIIIRILWLFINMSLVNRLINRVGMLTINNNNNLRNLIDFYNL